MFWIDVYTRDARKSIHLENDVGNPETLKLRVGENVESRIIFQVLILCPVLVPLQHQVELELDDVAPLLYLDDRLQPSGDVDDHGEDFIGHLGWVIALIIIRRSLQSIRKRRIKVLIIMFDLS